MHNCKYCGRELKSKAGQLRHEASCKDKELDEKLERMLDEQLDPDTRELYDIEEVSTDVVVSKPEIVQLEVMGGEETYYDGHPRRATKLKGLLSRTFDKRERHKIRQLIMKVENETYKG